MPRMVRSPAGVLATCVLAVSLIGCGAETIVSAPTDARGTAGQVGALAATIVGQTAIGSVSSTLADASGVVPKPVKRATARYLVARPDGAMSHLDPRPCVAVAGGGPYPRAGLPDAPGTAAQACAAATLHLIGAARVTTPAQAIAALAATAHDDTLDLRAAAAELNPKETR